MPETIDPPTQPETPPVVPEKKPTAGDKYRAEFAKLEPPKDETPPVEQPTETPSPPTEKPVEKPAAVEAPATSKPVSPLDALLGKEKPAEEKKEETPPDILKEFDEQKPNWSRAREVMKTQSAKIRELDGELQKAKSAPKPDTGEITAIAQERDALKAKIVEQETNLKAINAEYSDEYQNLLKQRGGTISKIASRAKAYGVDPDTLLSALSLPDGRFKSQQIKESLGELDSDDRARIHTLIEQLDQHDEAIGEFRKDLPQKWDEIQQRRDMQFREETEKNLKHLEVQYGKVVDELPKEIVTLREVPDDIPGATEWNNEVRSARESALNALRPNGTDFNQTVALAVKGARYDSLEKRYLQLHSDYSDAMKRLSEFDQSGPDFRGSKKPTTDIKKKPAQKYHDTLRAIQSQEE